MEQDLKPLTVKEFVELINKNLEIFEDIKIVGEVSGFKVSHNKWVFFSLKDEEALVECFLPIYYLNIEITDGMKVEVVGSPNLYNKSGRFRIKVKNIKPYGEGSILKAFLLLKEKLEKEGLFDIARKRKIIAFPEKIGVITSRDSAGFKDFIKILKGRCGGLKLFLINVFVQGDEAANQIINALNYFSESKDLYNLDAVVLIRGGGSLEDLFVFNDERMARAIFASKIPIVSAIGHEKDETIADLVADVRASTPSNGAEILVRQRQDVLNEVNHFEYTIYHKVKFILNEKISLVSNFYSLSSHFIKDQKYLFLNNLNMLGEKFNNFCDKILLLKEEIKNLENNLIGLIENKVTILKNDISSNTALLNSFSPYGVLKRGYSIVLNNSKKIIKSVNNLKIDESLEILLNDGSFESKVKKIFPKSKTLF